jgi:hypothetical protein
MATKKQKAAPEAVQNVTPTEDAPTTTTVEPVQLTIADLQLLARIVDLASRRGAFQAGELSQVGDAYNKLAGFLTYVESVQKKDEAEKAEAPTV